MAIRGVISLICLLGYLAAAFSAAVNETAGTSWVYVASDDSGKYLSALTSTLYISDDYGATWTQTKSPTLPWTAVASDSTGQKLMLSTTCTSGSYCQGPWTSTDRGATWVAPSSKDPYQNYYDLSGDSSGANAVTSAGGTYYRTANEGSTWGALGGLEPLYGGTACAMSGDSKTMIVDYYDYIYLNSANTNGKWVKTQGTPEARWRRLASDYTGKVLAGAEDLEYGSGGNYRSSWVVSVNTGSTWTALKATDQGEKYYSVAVSDDGAYVYCGGSMGLYIYNVAKNTTTKSNTGPAAVYSMATSKNGQYVIAESGGIWVSSNYGVDFKKVM